MKHLLLFFSAITALNATDYSITPQSIDKITQICKVAKAGDNIYLRAGVYEKAFPHIRCSGSSQGAVNLTAYPNEQVTIRSAWRVKGNYLSISNLNFKGKSDELNYESVIRQWWKPSKKLRQIGLYIEGHHIDVKNNTLGYYPSSGLKISGKSDYLTIEHNIIYNNAWWSTGGTGGLIVKSIHEFDGSKATKVKIVNKLFFANESRIFSHVFKKGFAKLTIDEGQSFLIQQKEDANKKGAKQGNYHGRYLVQNNLILFNGKGTSLNKADNIDMYANTLYCNGTTAKSIQAGGIRGNKTNHDRFIDNAIESCGEGKAVSVKGKDNLFKNNYVKSRTQRPQKGITLVKSLFRDPANFDFYTQAFGDRANKQLHSFDQMLRSNNIQVKATNYKIDSKRQVQDIIDGIPKTNRTEVLHLKDKILIKNIDNRGIKGLKKTFILKLK